MELNVSPVFEETLKAYNATKIDDKGRTVPKYRIIVHEGGTGCFYSEQTVLTDKGAKPICEVIAGDRVMSYNFDTGQDEYRTVTKAHKYDNKSPLLKVTLQTGVVIIATEDHEFYFKGNWHKLKHIVSLWNERALVGNT